MRYAIIHSWPGSRAGKMAGVGLGLGWVGKTKTKFFLEKRSMKKVRNHVPVFALLWQRWGCLYLF